ncbi:MAG: hypothetical protein ACKPKO_47370 [Candidatus Fonsibacter sp.]
MENTTKPISEDATTKQNKVEELRKYNRYYYHAHNKKASECEHCKNTFLIVSALRRHQGQKPQAQAATSSGHHREVQSRPDSNSVSIALLKETPHRLVYT